MKFDVQVVLPNTDAARAAWRDAYGDKTTYVALREICEKRRITADSLRSLAVQNNKTLSAVARKLLVHDKPALAAAWPDNSNRARRGRAMNAPGALVIPAGLGPLIEMIEGLCSDDETLRLQSVQAAREWLQAWER